MTTDPPESDDGYADLPPDESARLRVVFVAGGRLFGEKYTPWANGPKGRTSALRPRWKEERTFLFAKLREVHAHKPIDRLVHGDCRTDKHVPTGADKWAALWCIHKGVWSYGCPAPFPALGRAAGPKRTAVMFDDWHPFHDCVLLAFEGGIGTQRAVELAFERDMQVIDYRPKERK